MRAWRERRAAGPVAAHDSRFGPRDAPRITALQREAVYQHILDHIGHAGDLPLLVNHGDLGTARRLAREVSDDLQLVLDGLGWNETSNSTDVELDLPTEQLRRTFTRLRGRAVEQREASSYGIADTQAPYQRTLIVIETCDQVLAAIGTDIHPAPG